jgi:N-acetyl-anhydromuramyl-L-alanine amidase AmpD
MPSTSNILFIPNSNCFVNRQGFKPKYVVLHGTAGGSSAVNLAHYFQSTQNTANPVSAHYIIDQSGLVVQCNDEKDGAWANGFVSGTSGVSGDGIGNGCHDVWWDTDINPNNLTISIEHVKLNSDNSNQLTAAQQFASINLITEICTRNNIPFQKADENGGITGHYAIDPVNRQMCPGPYPWDVLFSDVLFMGVVQEMLSIQSVSEFFEEKTKDERWHCKITNQDIAFGILKYYRSCCQVGLNGLSQYGLPLSGEIHVPGSHQATYQNFERGRILYDPQNEVDRVPGLQGPCYPAHIDKELKVG